MVSIKVNMYINYPCNVTQLTKENTRYCDFHFFNMKEFILEIILNLKINKRN